jgi:hypothetical protein
MEILDNFVVKDSKIHLNQYALVIRHYTALAKETYTDKIYYVDDEGAHELEVNVVPKHQLLEIISKTELDNSQYSYMEGIELKTQDFNREIEEIASYGSLEAYEASLPQAQDEFNLDMDYRMSKMELGL